MLHKEAMRKDSMPCIIDVVLLSISCIRIYMIFKVGTVTIKH